MAMRGYEVRFNIYAESQEEADAVSQAIKGFINESARQGIAVTATKITDAVARWGGNPFIKNRITNYFKNGR